MKYLDGGNKGTQNGNQDVHDSQWQCDHLDGHDSQDSQQVGQTGLDINFTESLVLFFLNILANNLFLNLIGIK